MIENRNSHERRDRNEEISGRGDKKEKRRSGRHASNQKLRGRVTQIPLDELDEEDWDEFLE